MKYGADEEKLARILFNLSHDVILLLDKSGDILDINLRGEELTGYARSELLKMNAFERLIVPEDHSIMRKVVQDTFEGKDSKYHERWRTKAGTTIYFDGLTVPRKSASGEIISTFCTLRDITKQIEAEELLKRVEVEYKDLFDSTLDGVYQTDADGDFVLMNNAGAKIFDHERPEQMIGRNVLEYWRDPKDRDVLMAVLEIQKKVSAYPIRARKKNGEPIDLEGSCRRIEGENGSFLGTQGILRDVTEIREKEKALRASEEQYRTLVENIPIGIYRNTGGPQGRFLQANTAIAKIFGYGTVEEFMKIPVSELYQNPDERKRFLEKLGKCRRIKSAELKLRKKDGTPIWCSVTAHVTYDSKGGILSTDGTVEDITEQKQAEDERRKLHAQLVQAQKMETVGQLAGGIAHDFNNILTAIIGYGHLLMVKMKGDEPLRRYAEHILSLSDRAANLTQSLLAFSRKQIMNTRPVDINSIVRKVEKLLVRVIGEDIELKTFLSERDLTVMADPLQIEQVFMNLATNAKDAMPEGGQLAVVTEVIELDEVFINTHGYGNTGRYALISVTDTGGGMDKETTDKIFEPFFTTKEVGKGTGLGLAIVYGIVKQHGGYINVLSESGKGTTFKVYLPMTRADVEGSKPELIQPVKKGTETILLAEDETEVRTFIKTMLEEYGYTVIEEVDGEDAKNKFYMHKDKIRLVILDVIMPKEIGREVYMKIKEVSPGIRAIFMSGYSADIIQKKGVLADVELVSKPIAPQALLVKIREILDREKE